MEGVEGVLVVGGWAQTVVIWLGTGHGVGGGGGGPRHAGGGGHWMRELRLNVVMMFINIWLELWQTIEHWGKSLDHLLRLMIVLLIVLMKVMR